MYKVGDQQVKLKDDLTIEEEETVNDILCNVNSTGNVVTTKLTNDQLVKLLAIITISVSGDLIDYRKVKRTIAANIIRDFFLQEMYITKSIKTILTDYGNNTTPQLTATNV